MPATSLAAGHVEPKIAIAVENLEATGTFPGIPVGCDSNADTLVDAGDLACGRTRTLLPRALVSG